MLALAGGAEVGVIDALVNINGGTTDFQTKGESEARAGAVPTSLVTELAQSSAN